MALPGSGAISLSQIASQYGGSAPHSLKDYYRNGTEGVPDTVTTQSIPTSGEIGLKDFYGSSETNNRDIRLICILRLIIMDLASPHKAAQPPLLPFLMVQMLWLGNLYFVRGKVT